MTGRLTPRQEADFRWIATLAADPDAMVGADRLATLWAAYEAVRGELDALQAAPCRCPCHGDDPADSGPVGDQVAAWPEHYIVNDDHTGCECDAGDCDAMSREFFGRQAGPCIKIAGHRGGHLDRDGQIWATVSA